MLDVTEMGGSGNAAEAPSDGNDLTSHRGSCLYRERIAKEERNFRRGWERPVPVPEIDFYDPLWLSSSPADYWTARRHQARQADAANQAKVLARGTSISSSAPARTRRGGAHGGSERVAMKIPITTAERMASAAQRRLDFGPSAADLLSSAIAQELCHIRVDKKWATPRAAAAAECTRPTRCGVHGMACTSQPHGLHATACMPC